MPRKKKRQTRRGNGEGSIHQRKDGRWCGQVTTGYNEEGKPIRKTFYGKTREEVARKVTATSNDVFNGCISIDEAESLTVDKLMMDFLWTFKKPTVSDVTFEWYYNIAKTHVIPALGKIKIDELTPL